MNDKYGETSAFTFKIKSRVIFIRLNNREGILKKDVDSIELHNIDAEIITQNGIIFVQLTKQEKYEIYERLDNKTIFIIGK